MIEILVRLCPSDGTEPREIGRMQIENQGDASDEIGDGSAWYSITTTGDTAAGPYGPIRDTVAHFRGHWVWELIAAAAMGVARADGWKHQRWKARK